VYPEDLTINIQTFYREKNFQSENASSIQVIYL